MSHYYLMTARATNENGETKVIAQTRADAKAALNMLRRIILAWGGRREETSADLLAMDLMNKVDAGTPQGLSNEFTGMRMIIQREDMTDEAIAAQKG